MNRTSGISRRAAGSRNEGLTMVEVALAASILVVVLLSIGGVMVSVSHGRETVSARRQVLARLESLVEDIKGTSADAVVSQYANKTYSLGSSILGVTSTASPVLVTVDSTNPLLLTVNCAATYTIRGVAETMNLSTQIYNP